MKLSALIYQHLLRGKRKTSDIERAFMNLGYGQREVLGSLGYLGGSGQIFNVGSVRVQRRKEHWFTT